MNQRLLNQWFYGWLMTVGAVHVLGGLLLISLSSEFFSGYGAYFLTQFSVPVTSQSEALFAGFLKIFCATVVSWGLLFCLGVWAYRHSSEWIYKGLLLAAVLLWFSLDTLLSLLYGLHWHLSVNLPVLFALVLPLALWRAEPSEELSVDSQIVLNNPEIKRVLLTGGTGFIGLPLVNMLLRNDVELTVLTRKPERAIKKMAGPIRWLRCFDELPASAEFDAVINLAGESLAEGRWTAAKKQRLFASRIGTTKELCSWLQRAEHKPKLLISASAVGYYGPQDQTPLDEASAPVASFSHELCQQWEQAAQDMAELGIRVCCVRLGVVLAKTGGAFEQIQRPCQFKVSAQFGHGKQYFSWVHLEDVLRALGFLLDRGVDLPQRVYNLCAPEALSYRDLSAALKQHYKTWLTLAIPPWFLKLALGEMADELLLSGQNVVPQNLIDAGFQFKFENIHQALQSFQSSHDSTLNSVNKPATQK